MKNKWIVLLLLVTMLFTMTACSSKTPSTGANEGTQTTDSAAATGDTAAETQQASKVEPDTVVGKVNGVELKYGDVEALYESSVNQVAMMYSQYGYAFDPNDAATVTQMRTDAINTMVEQMAMEQKLEEMGMGLTEEDIKGFETKAKEDFEMMVTSFMATQGVDEATAKAAVEDYGYNETVLAFYRRVEETSKRLHTVTDPTVEVTAEEVQAQYEELVEADKTNFTASADNFASSVLAGNTVYYYPAGFRTVKILTLYMEEEIAEQVLNLQNEIYTCSYYISSYEAMMSTDMDDNTKLTYKTMLDYYKEQKDEKTAQLEDLQEQGLAQIQEKADEILALAQAEGADFDALVAEYSEEENVSSLENGYPINASCALYDVGVMKAAMALENVGDVSDLVGNPGGYYIIQYTGELPETTVELSQVEETVTAMVLKNKQDEAFDAKKEELLAACEIETFVSGL